MMHTFGWKIVSVLVLCSSVFSSCNRPKGESQSGEAVALPIIKQAPSFIGENYDGTQFTSTSLLGNVWVASFMFTQCSGVCPVMNGEQTGLQQEFASKGVKFVSISVDPVNDTREVLAAYAATYNAKPTSWYMLRMPIDSVRALAVKGFLVSDPIEPAAHSPRFILVDKKQNIRGYYDSMDSLKVQQLRNDIPKVLLEQQ